MDVGVQDPHPLALSRKAGSKVHCDCALADASFAAVHRNDAVDLVQYAIAMHSANGKLKTRPPVWHSCLTTKRLDEETYRLGAGSAVHRNETAETDSIKKCPRAPSQKYSVTTIL